MKPPGTTATKTSASSSTGRRITAGEKSSRSATCYQRKRGTGAAQDAMALSRSAARIADSQDAQTDPRANGHELSEFAVPANRPGAVAVSNVAGSVSARA